MRCCRVWVAVKAVALRAAGTALKVALRHTAQRRLQAASGTLARFTAAPVEAAVREAAARLRGTAAHLEAVNPRAVLGRGYAIALRGELPVLSSQELTPGDQVQVRVAHGSFRARVTEVAAPPEAEVFAAPDPDEPAPHSQVRS